MFGAEPIDDTGGERSLRSDNGQIGVDRFGGGEIVGCRNAGGGLRDTRISGRCVDVCAGVPGEFPDERVFASSAADYEDSQLILRLSDRRNKTIVCPTHSRIEEVEGAA